MNHSTSRIFTTTLCLTLLALLAACAGHAPKPGPSTRVVLLPQDNVPNTAVQVQGIKEGAAQVLDKPYLQASVGQAASITVSLTTAENLAKEYPILSRKIDLPQESFMLTFLTGTSNLTEQSLETLKTVLARAKARVASEVLVTAHTDRQGTIESNDRLSVQRAESVRKLLIDQGLAPERVEAVGRGERQPLVPTDDEVAEPRNRRAEVVIR